MGALISKDAPNELIVIPKACESFDPRDLAPIRVPKGNKNREPICKVCEKLCCGGYCYLL